VLDLHDRYPGAEDGFFLHIMLGHGGKAAGSFGSGSV
jgi:hypothetical protein